MDRDALFHVVRAAADITGERDFVVIGSQAIVAVHPDAPDEMLRSIEADIYSLHNPDRGSGFEGAIGDGSPFHANFGYYAHSVGPETAKAPAGWEERLVEVDVPPSPRARQAVTAWCMEVHDLVLAKLARGDQRDWDFAREAIKAGMVQPDKLLGLVPTMPVSDQVLDHIRGAVVGLAKRSV